MSWKYDDDRCECGDVASEKHALFDCKLSADVRRRWKKKMDAGYVDVYEAIEAKQ